jgi:hypothetical protein
VRELARQGTFRLSEATVTFAWANGANVRGYATPDTLAVAYRYRFREEWQDVQQRIELARTPCRFGGSRVWFRCPRCWRRVAILYLFGWPACRTCARLRYPSQSDDAIGRSWRRTWRIERRLAAGAAKWNFRRPKGMRRATFKRLMSAWLDEQELRDELLASYMARAGWI